MSKRPFVILTVSQPNLIPWKANVPLIILFKMSNFVISPPPKAVTAGSTIDTEQFCKCGSQPTEYLKF